MMSEINQAEWDAAFGVNWGTELGIDMAELRMEYPSTAVQGRLRREGEAKAKLYWEHAERVREASEASMSKIMRRLKTADFDEAERLLLRQVVPVVQPELLRKPETLAVRRAKYNFSDHQVRQANMAYERWEAEGTGYDE